MLFLQSVLFHLLLLELEPQQPVMEIASSFDSLQKELFGVGHMEQELCLLGLTDGDPMCLEVCWVAVCTHQVCNMGWAMSREFHMLGEMLVEQTSPFLFHYLFHHLPSFKDSFCSG